MARVRPQVYVLPESFTFCSLWGQGQPEPGSTYSQGKAGVPEPGSAQGWGYIRVKIGLGFELGLGVPPVASSDFVFAGVRGSGVWGQMFGVIRFSG